MSKLCAQSSTHLLCPKTLARSTRPLLGPFVRRRKKTPRPSAWNQQGSLILLALLRVWLLAVVDVPELSHIHYTARKTLASLAQETLVVPDYIQCPVVLPRSVESFVVVRLGFMCHTLPFRVGSSYVLCLYLEAPLCDVPHVGNDKSMNRTTN